MLANLHSLYNLKFVASVPLILQSILKYSKDVADLFNWKLNVFAWQNSSVLGSDEVCVSHVELKADWLVFTRTLIMPVVVIRVLVHWTRIPLVGEESKGK